MSSELKKTIKINPEIFNVRSGNETRKNREKRKQTVTPMISPNILKNKLLKRIKEHKMKETNHLSSDKGINEISNNNSSRPHLVDSTNITNYTNEFNDSIEYLQSLSKERKKEEEINKKREQLHNSTIRTYNNHSHQPYVQLELPEELKNSYSPSQLATTTIQEPPMKIQYKLDNSVPYGCLKGGYKPTYRDLNKTQKRYEITTPNAALNIHSERETRLNLLKEKIKQKYQTPSPIPTTNYDISSLDDSQTTSTQMMTRNYIQPIKTPILQTIQPIQSVITDVKPHIPIPIMNSEIQTSLTPEKNEIHTSFSKNINVGGSEPTPMKHKIMKKTIKRKYTLGKSKIQKSVAVLIKDNQTRKRVIHAQKDLKRHPINNVKQYLREHNLIKSGSGTPNDVIRKLYESAMLSGEITNKNKENLIHNFMKESDS